MLFGTICCGSAGSGFRLLRAAAMYSAYGGKGPLDDLAAMLASHTHHNHPIGSALKQQIVLYANELKQVNVLKRSTDTIKFAERVYVDVLI